MRLSRYGIFVLCFILLSLAVQAGPWQVNQLAVYPSDVKMVAGQSVRFTALVTDANNCSHTPRGLTWYATGGTINQRGRFTAYNTSGYFTITVQYRHQRASARVIVKTLAPSVVRVVISPTNPRVLVGQTAYFRATAYDSYNRPVNCNFSWRTNGGSISQNGMFRAGYGVGTYQVWARDRRSGREGVSYIQIIRGGFPPFPPIPPTPQPTPGRIVITDFDSGGGNFFTPKVKIKLRVYGSGAQTVRLYAISNGGRYSELSARSCRHGQEVFLKSKYDRFSVKRFEIRLYNNMGRVIARVTKSAR